MKLKFQQMRGWFLKSGSGSTTAGKEKKLNIKTKTNLKKNLFFPFFKYFGQYVPQRMSKLNKIVRTEIILTI